jgi:hypothetical protein
MASAAITLNTGSKVDGHAIAGTAVTCESNCQVSFLVIPSTAPTTGPTTAPTTTPTAVPTSVPTASPTVIPTTIPTAAPSYSFTPTALPTASPSTGYALTVKDIGKCADYAIFGSSAVTFAGVPSSVYGNIGISPGTSITVATGPIANVLKTGI